MAFTPPYCIDEEELMSLKSLLEEDDDATAVDRDIEQMKRRCLSMAAKLQDVEVLPPEAVAWAIGVEATAAQMEQTMGALAEDIRRGMAVLALRPGEEAKENDLRRLVVAEQLVDLAGVEVVRCMAEVLDSDLADGIVPTPEKVAAAAVLKSAVVDIGMHARMVTLAGRFRRGAAAFATRPGEEALVGVLERWAAKADTDMNTMRLYQDAGSMQPAKAEVENDDGCQDDRSIDLALP
ncbi:hypothetical protein PVAP13_9NG715400 [Panicum virgatum]|uniref:Uncharacterized protein n=1 Tax=Panicum virgatum TaxID=38727 RepID=A0A8T0MSQ0_PANVG|nr:hypothetical protein PVAP13_9NG715400 [Panicum virgatum]